MSRWRRNTGYISLAIFSALAGYFSFESSNEETSNNINHASVSDMIASGINKYDTGFVEDLDPIDEDVTNILSTIAQSDEEMYIVETWHEYDYLFDEPEFHHGLKAVAPVSATLLTHYAQLQPVSLSTDQSRDYLNSENYSFLLAMMIMCDKCAFGFMFYEKYALGRQMSLEEYKAFAKSPEFDTSIQAAMSIAEYQKLYKEKIN